MDCKIYVACKMTGRDKLEMMNRATLVCDVLKGYGLHPISPVIEEGIKNETGELVQTSTEQLHGFWKRDKYIISNLAHVILLDEFHRKSSGMEREYGYARYCLWKPVVTIMTLDGPNVAQFEDDVIVSSINEAAVLIAEKWGTRPKRWKWRLKMLWRTLPKWLKRQLLAWK